MGRAFRVSLEDIIPSTSVGRWYRSHKRIRIKEREGRTEGERERRREEKRKKKHWTEIKIQRIISGSVYRNSFCLMILNCLRD